MTRSWHVLEVLEPGADGVFRHVEGVCRRLLAEPVTLDLAYSSIRGSDRLRALVAEVGSAGGATLDLRTSNAPGPSDLRAIFRLRALVARRRPRLIHAHSSKAGALVRGLRLLGVRQPIVYTPHAYYGMGSGTGPKAAFFNAVERILGRVGWTVHVSEDEAEWARATLGIAGPRCRVIPNSVDTDRFTPGTSADRDGLRRELGWPADARILGSVGRLSAQKDPVTLYRALASAMVREPRLHLLHVGQGGLAPALDEVVRAAGIGDRVRRRDYLPDTSAFYRGLDGFVSTSRYEGLPIAVLEALAAGLPLLLSDVPGHRGFARLGLDQLWMAPAGDVEAWIRSLVEWARRGPAPSNHRSVAVSRYGLAAGLEPLLDLYGEVLGEPRRPEPGGMGRALDGRGMG